MQASFLIVKKHIVSIQKKSNYRFLNKRANSPKSYVMGLRAVLALLSFSVQQNYFFCQICLP